MTTDLDGPRYPDYSSQIQRMRTFGHFPEVCPAKPNELAEAGFFYTGTGDCVRCFHCAKRWFHWEAGENCWSEHARHSPNCKFIHVMKGSKYVQKVQIQYGMTTASKLQQFDTPIARPRHPEYTSEVKRLHTYSGVTGIGSKKVKVMAEAGYFLNDSGDHVRCFHCGELWRRWHATAGDPWREHALHNPQCEFVRAIKGDKYIKETKYYNKVQRHDVQKSGLTSRKNDVAVGNQVTTPSGPGWSVSTTMISTFDEHSLLEENRQLKEEKVCKICMDNEVTIAFLPCGHLCCCDKCAVGLHICPICRARVVQRAKIFLS